MNKLITIEYDEYLELVKYKEMIATIKLVGEYHLTDGFAGPKAIPHKMIFSSEKLFDFLTPDCFVPTTIELVREDKHE